jgi:hypothetical protein
MMPLNRAPVSAAPRHLQPPKMPMLKPNPLSLIGQPLVAHRAPKIANAIVSPTNPNLKIIIKTSDQVSEADKNLGKTGSNMIIT